MRMKKLAVVVGILAFIHCAPKSEPGAPAKSDTAPKVEDTAAAETYIRGALAQWVDAANRDDYASALKVWAPDLVGWYPGIPDTNYAQQEEYAKHPQPSNTKYKLSVDEVMVSGNMAVVRDTWIVTTNGYPVTLRSFEVWRKQPDATWKISRYLSAAEPAGK